MSIQDKLDAHKLFIDSNFEDGVQFNALNLTDEEKAEFRKIDARGIELYNACLINLDMSGMDFSGANLQNCAMIGVNIIGTKFDDANMTNCSLMLAVYNNDTSFHEADLSYANIKEMTLFGAGFTGAKFVKTITSSASQS